MCLPTASVEGFHYTIPTSALVTKFGSYLEKVLCQTVYLLQLTSLISILNLNFAKFGPFSSRV